mmetsp:Transcript_49945/g.55769  ORF Transcript_49945/g.55769 Transcript_49945/m.55769 type:complete len:886 (+) Transcript_49945:3-2660(+)
MITSMTCHLGTVLLLVSQLVAGGLYYYNHHDSYLPYFKRAFRYSHPTSSSGISGYRFLDIYSLVIPYIFVITFAGSCIIGTATAMAAEDVCDNNNNNNDNGDSNDNTCSSPQQQQRESMTKEYEEYPSSNWIEPLRQVLFYVLGSVHYFDHDERDSPTSNPTIIAPTRTQLYYTSHPDRISLAAVAIWAYLIPHLYIEYAQFKLSLEYHQRNKKEQISEGNTGGTIITDTTIVQIQKTLTRCFWGNLVYGMLVYGISASFVCYMTTSPSSSLSSASDNTNESNISNNGGGGLDRRGSDIVTGLSRLFAGVITLLLSVLFCQWIGVYKSVTTDSQRRRLRPTRTANDDADDNNNKDHTNNMYRYYYNYRSIRELKVDFSYALQYRLIATYFFHVYFSCDTNHDFDSDAVLPNSIVYGILIGIVLGISLIVVVNKVRTNSILKKYKVYIASFMATILSFASVVCIGFGVYFIERVWREDKTKEATTATAFAATTIVPEITFYVCCVWGGIVCFGVHAVAIYLSSTTNNTASRYNSEVFQEDAPGLQQVKKFVKQKEKKIKKLLHHEKQEQGQELEGKNENKLDSSGSRKNNTHDEKEEIPSTTVQLQVPLPPSYWSLITSKLGFGTRRSTSTFDSNNKDKEKSSASTSLSSVLFQTGRNIHNIVWHTSSIFFLYMTLVNIGATHQQNLVRSHLNDAFTVLYPPDYQTGKMCAWDDKTPQGNIRTFDKLDEVYDAGYKLIHCGECGKCSNWNDLKLQWTTRTFLAKVAKKCAQKSILGSVDSVTECNEKTIGFTRECAKCWTEDGLCARNNCFWIFLQSMMINAITDFRVGFNDITSATCDEAMCGPVFGPCVGAIRRKMNIISDIERPLSQQCLPVQEDWSIIFNSE